MIKTRYDMSIECEMVKGNINRMCTTDDISELEDMLLYCELRVKQIYYYNKRRIEDEM